MSQSLKDQLLGLGYKPAAKPEAPARRDGSQAQPPRDRGVPSDRGRPGHQPSDRPRGDRGPIPARPGQAKPGPRGAGDRRPPTAGKPAEARRPRPPRSQEEIDLGKAYALRAQKEKDERIEAERQRQEDARLRREAKARLADLLKDRQLNDPAADIARHFEYGGKIKRVHVTAEQLKALNAGELGVVQLDGRYLLFPMALVAEAEAVFAPAVALKVDPAADPGDDPYADPAYQVPDDLIW